MVSTDGNVADEVPVVKRFTFNRSYWLTGQKLSDSQRHSFYDSVCDYVFAGAIPDFSNDPILDLVWTNVVPNLDASVARSLDGSKGGRGNKGGKVGKKPSLKGTSKGTDKASDKAPKKSETPINSYPSPTQSPINSYPSPASFSNEEGDYYDSSYYSHDEMTFADEDINF